MGFPVSVIPNKYILDFEHCCLVRRTDLEMDSVVDNGLHPRTIPK